MPNFKSICASRRYCSDCRGSEVWRGRFGAPEVCPFGVESGQIAAEVTKKSPISGQIMSHEYLCQSRQHCGDCRTRPAWRKAFGMPEVCPFAAGDVEVLGHVPVPYASSEEIPGLCAGCPKLTAKQECRGCGCKSEPLRPIAEIKICREKRWIRRTEKQTEDKEIP